MTDAGTRRSPTTFSALEHGEFRWLFAGQIVAHLGQRMQEFALGWLVVQFAVRDGDPSLGGFYLGLMSISRAAPGLGFGLFAGVLADRMDRRDLLIATRVASAAVAAVLAALVIADRVNIAVVMVLSAAAAAAFSFDPPGRQAIVPSIVPARDLFSAMGLTRASMQVAATIGPLVAGLLIVPIGVGGVILTKTALLFASVGALVPLRRRPVEAGARCLGVFASMREGLGYVGGEKLVRWLVILQLIFGLLAQSTQQLLPALAVGPLDVGAVELSWLLAAMGIGAMVGAFLLATAGGLERRGVLLIASLILAGLTMVVLGAQRGLVGALIALAVFGVLQQLFLGTQAVVLQFAAPDRLRGRVMGIQSVIFMSFNPIGVLAVGTLGSFIGISNAIMLAGILVAVAGTFVALRAPVVRDLRAGEDARLAQTYGVASPEPVGADE